MVGIPGPTPADGEGPDSRFCQPHGADVLFLLRGGATRVFAHKVYLATSCSKFYDLFSLDLAGDSGSGEEQELEGAESSEEEEQSRRGAKEQAGRTKSLDIDKEGCEGGARGQNRAPLLQQGSLRTSQSDNALPARVQWAGRALSGWGRGFLSVCLEHVDDPMTGRPRHMTVVAMDGLLQEEPFQVRPRNISAALKSTF